MKDRYFKFLAVTLLIGVILAFVNPAKATNNARPDSAPAAQAGSPGTH